MRWWIEPSSTKTSRLRRRPTPTDVVSPRTPPKNLTGDTGAAGRKKPTEADERLRGAERARGRASLTSLSTAIYQAGENAVRRRARRSYSR